MDSVKAQKILPTKNYKVLKVWKVLKSISRYLDVLNRKTYVHSCEFMWFSVILYDFKVKSDYLLICAYMGFLWQLCEVGWNLRNFMHKWEKLNDYFFGHRAKTRGTRKICKKLVKSHVKLLKMVNWGNLDGHKTVFSKDFLDEDLKNT